MPVEKFRASMVRRYDKLRFFALIVGNARSGSTALGAVLDAHPNAAVANESAASVAAWRNLDREAILNEVFENTSVRRREGRLSEGYDYTIATDAAQVDCDVLVAGDKIWNPTTLMLHVDFGLLSRLERILGAPIKMIHAVRHPLDVIATMHARSGAPLADRIRTYFLFCESIMALRDRCDDTRLIDAHHEVLIADPDAEIRRICDFLLLDCHVRYLAACKERLFRQPKETRSTVPWTESLLGEIRRRMMKYPFLDQYCVTAIPE